MDNSVAQGRKNVTISLLHGKNEKKNVTKYHHGWLDLASSRIEVSKSYNMQEWDKKMCWHIRYATFQVDFDLVVLVIHNGLRLAKIYMNLQRIPLYKYVILFSNLILV